MWTTSLEDKKAKLRATRSSTTRPAPETRTATMTATTMTAANMPFPADTAYVMHDLTLQASCLGAWRDLLQAADYGESSADDDLQECKYGSISFVHQGYDDNDAYFDALCCEWEEKHLPHTGARAVGKGGPYAARHVRLARGDTRSGPVLGNGRRRR